MGEKGKAEKTLLKVFTVGRIKIDGDSYIPAVAVDAYNELYGTGYESDDADLETCSFPQNKLRLKKIKEESV